MAEQQLPRCPASMMNDARKIQQICLPDDAGWWAVGREGITEIVPYGEKGMYCNLTWFAVYAGDEIVSRVNANCVADVWYGKDG